MLCISTPSNSTTAARVLAEKEQVARELALKQAKEQEAREVKVYHSFPTRYHSALIIT